MEKRKIYGTILGTIFFALMLLGLTYAYFYWSNAEEDNTNINLVVKKGLENAIVYNQGTSILSTDGRTLDPGDSYTDGISATIEFWQKPNIDKTIYGQVSLKVLEMLSLAGNNDANVGKTDTIKWVVTTYTVDNSSEVLLAQGTFNGKRKGEKFPMTEDFVLNKIQTFYKIYIWFDESAVDTNALIIGETLSTEISASASDVRSHYGVPAIQVLTTLGLSDDLKENEPNFKVNSPNVTAYAESISSGQASSLSSYISGNKMLGTGITFNSSNGKYTLSGTSSSQSYNNNSVGKYTCNSNTSSCSTVYKINSVSVSEYSTDYSESTWKTYSANLTSNANKTVASSYTFDGTYYQLSETIVSSVSYSNSYLNYYTCNNNTGTNCSVLYQIDSVSGTSATTPLRKERVRNYNYATNVDIYTGAPSEFNADDIGIFQAQDDLGTSYYFRGNVENNYVKFAKNAEGQDMYWRIIRINGDGSIRMLYDGTAAYPNGTETDDKFVGISKFNGTQSDNAYVGYMYGTPGSSTYDATHDNTNNSTIKTYLDNWYKTNIVDTGYSSYVADAIYCNDRSRVTDYETYSSWFGDGTIIGGGFGTENTLYGFFGRITDLELYYFMPTIKCSQDNDKFMVGDSLGNGDLTYSVGLITSDEVLMAGGYEDNELIYLYNGSDNYWTMTPADFNSDLGFASVQFVSEGTFLLNGKVTSSKGVRPVISLRSSAISGGTGTINDPFVIPS